MKQEGSIRRMRSVIVELGTSVIATVPRKLGTSTTFTLPSKLRTYVIATFWPVRKFKY